MEGVFFRCPPAWEKLLPPGVFGAERAEELAARCWPLLVLTRRGCEELGDTAAMCRVLLAPGDRALSLEHVSAAGPVRPAAAAPAGRHRHRAPGVPPAGPPGAGGRASAAAGGKTVAAATDS